MNTEKLMESFKSLTDRYEKKENVLNEAIKTIDDIVKENEITFDIKSMKKGSIKLLKEALSGTKEVIDIPAPHDDLIINEKTQAIITSEPLLEAFHVLRSKNIDYGYIRFAESKYIDKKEFDRTYAEHKMINLDIVNPYPNEHAARVIEPGQFEEGSFRRKNIEVGINIIIGKLKGETSTTTQAYRFKVDKFTAVEAKKWLKDNNVKYILFEPAKKENENIQYSCECLKCHYKMVSSKHCRDIKCPKCGGEMRREDRPGIGNNILEKSVEVDEIYRVDDEKKECSIYIYGDIGSTIDGDEIAKIIRKYDDMGYKITEYINSGGGEVINGFSIVAENLKAKGKIRTQNDGLAGSMAGIILMSGRDVSMMDYATLMIHEPSISGSTMDDPDIDEKDKRGLQAIRDSLLKIVQKRSGKTKQEIVEIMKEETWYNANQSKGNGFVDRVIRPKIKEADLYLNKIREFIPFDKPALIECNNGTDTRIYNDTNVPKTWDYSKFDDAELYQMHAGIHNEGKRYSLTTENAPDKNIVNRHVLIKNEMLKRKIEHFDLTELDVLSDKAEGICITDVIDSIKEGISLREPLICIKGDVLNSGMADNIEIVINHPLYDTKFINYIKKKIKEKLPDRIKDKIKIDVDKDCGENLFVPIANMELKIINSEDRKLYKVNGGYFNKQRIEIEK